MQPAAATQATPDQSELLTRRGIAALKAGELAQAQELLAQATEANPRNEQAWLWLSGTTQDAEEQRYCLERVLAINPQHPAAQRGLERLPRAPEPAVPPAEPPLSQDTPAPAPPEPAAAVAPTPPAAAGPHLPNPARHAQFEADITFVVGEFGKHVGREAVVRGLIERRGCSWSEAEEFIAFVELKHRTRIAARQSPLLIFLGTLTLIAGLVALTRCSLLISWQLRATGFFDPRLFIGAATGLAMISGSLIGLWQTIRSLWR
jgi:hypothetical protein